MIRIFFSLMLCRASMLIGKYVFQIARELRLRDIGGIIVVDFIDMADDCKLVSLSLSFLL